MRILFMSNLFSSYESPLRKALFELNVATFDMSDKLHERMHEVEFIIYSPVKVDDQLIVQDFSIYENNKAVFSLYAGVEHIINNPSLDRPLVKMVDDGLTSGMVEWCVAHTLRYHLGIDRHILGQDGFWRHNIKPPLACERRVGILGLGTLGEPTAKALQYLNFDVGGWSKKAKNIKGIRCFHGNDGLRDILNFTEILIVLLPLTKETFHIINSETLSFMSRNSTIINAGRGDLIDDGALLQNLKSGHISNAVLDVFSIEPLPSTHPYWVHPKVTVTPHIAADTPIESSSKAIARNIKLILQGKEPLGLVDVKRGY
ncbi:MAG: glyoxylate/hydroxypyruvate reductase A [Paracoccaceae bacterium]|nr:glyoxylate/hydroxypyruvate reductase A [Paracoccaceae bacterium]